MEDKELKKLAKEIFEKIKKKYYETAKEMIQYFQQELL